MGFRKTHKSNRYRLRHKKTRKNKMMKAGEMQIPPGEMQIPPGEMQIPAEEPEDIMNCEVVQNYKLNKYKNKSNTVKEDIIKIGNIDTKIIYVIPKNVMIESVDTLQKPVFNIFGIHKKTSDTKHNFHCVSTEHRVVLQCKTYTLTFMLG